MSVTLSTQNYSATSVVDLSAETKRVHISLPVETAAEALEQVLDTKKVEVVLVDGPVTLSYFDISRLAHKQTVATGTRALVNFQARLQQSVQELREKIVKATSSGASVLNVAITTTSSKTNGQLLTVQVEDIDLLLHLINQEVTLVQGSSNKALKTNQFTAITGTLAQGTTFTVQTTSQSQGEDLTVVQVVLSTGEVLTATVKTQHNSNAALNETSLSTYATLQDAARAIRIYSAALESLKTSRSIILKKVDSTVTPIRTTGTAGFLDEGLFWPVRPNQGTAVTGLYSSKQDRVKAIFDKITRTGEPLEYIPDNTSNYKQEAANGRPVFYTPSIPGQRKDQEMRDALKAGFVVLAEKPAFANADLAKDFLTTITEEERSRLYFGWHYQHHLLYDKIWADVKKGTFGKIKHIRDYFSVPMILQNNRIFEPSQGGAGIDIYCYNLHGAVRLLGFNQKYEVTQSNIKSAQDLNPANKDLSIIDIVLDTKLRAENGATLELFATFEADTHLHSEIEIEFEDGTRLLGKEFVHFHMMVNSPFTAISIKRPGSPRWEDYVTAEDRQHTEYTNTTYDQQVEFIRKIATGESKYDFTDDFRGLGLEANIRLHEIIDDVFVKGGFAKKTGA